VLDHEEAARPSLLRDVARAGVDWVQLRDRRCEAGELLEASDALAEQAPGLRLVVNRRCDVAWAARAFGVHLGFDGVAPTQARDLLGERAWIGVSCHAPEEVDAGCGADYAHLAPIFPPLSKASERRALGLQALALASRRGLPVIAQGGLCADNARAAVEAGAAGIAVTGSILQADDPARATRALRDALDGAHRA
jgi:thiamine-phosphate pyrophosphorylase